MQYFASLSIPAAQLPLQLILSAGFGWLTLQRKALTVSGTVAALLLGNVVIVCSGFLALIPLLLFFTGSLLLARFPATAEVAGDKKYGQPRDAIQVLSNGGVYVVCSLLEYATGNAAFYHGLFASMAIAAADTWSSETGMRLQGNTYTFPSFRPVTPGISGGISAGGTMAGLAGAILISSSGYLLSAGNFPFGAVVAAGFTGMLLDSLLGHYFQVKYLDAATGIWRDQASRSLQRKGLRCVTNDTVNVISQAVVTLVFLLLADRAFPFIN